MPGRLTPTGAIPHSRTVGVGSVPRVSSSRVIGLTVEDLPFVVSMLSIVKLQAVTRASYY